VQQLKDLLQGEQEAADGLTNLLSALERRVTALLEDVERGGGREGGRDTPGGRRRSSPGGIGREGWLQEFLQELRQLQLQWRSVRRATRMSQGAQRLFLPADALVYLKKSSEGHYAGGEEEGKEDTTAGLNGEWEDRARIWGVRGGSEGEREGERGAMLCELDGDKVHALQRALRSLLRRLSTLISEDGGEGERVHVQEQARSLALAVAHLGVALPATFSSFPSSSSFSSYSALPVRPLTRERELLEGFDSLLVPRLKPSELQRRVQKLQRKVLGERRALMWGINNTTANSVDGQEEDDEDEDEEEDEEVANEYTAAAGMKSSQPTSRTTGRRGMGEHR